VQKLDKRRLQVGITENKFMFSCTKRLQLLGDFVLQTPYRGFAPGPHWGTSVPQTLLLHAL